MAKRSRSSKKRIAIMVPVVIVLLLVVLGVGGWSYHEQPRFCSDMCHIMDPYLESWGGADNGAGVHAAAGVTCLDCHVPTIQEQVNELVVYVKGDYTIPLEELELPDAFCYDCHLLDEHENKDQVVARMAAMEMNPHDSHLIGEIGCGTCHNMHKPSEDQCAVCHDPVATGAGWTTEELTYTAEIQVWDPEMDCTVCKSMVSYVESLEDSESLAHGYAHAHPEVQVREGQEGLICLDCHEQAELEAVHLDARPDSRISKIKPDDEFCLDCHVDNEHSSYEQVIERTADYAYDGHQTNPHAPHRHMEGHADSRELEGCYTCHKMHKEPQLINSFFGCHHSGTFKPCDTCHEDRSSLVNW